MLPYQKSYIRSRGLAAQAIKAGLVDECQVIAGEQRGTTGTLLCRGALDDAQRLAALLREDDGDMESRFMLGWFHWYRYLALPESQDHSALEEAIQALTRCFVAGAEELPGPLLPLLAENAISTAVTLLQQVLTTSDLTLMRTGTRWPPHSRRRWPTSAAGTASRHSCSLPSAVAHFACHGDSDPTDPSQSLLLLHDHETDPLTVASLAPVRLDQARLAYLSACRTAFNSSTDLVDEGIHLTTAFQLAGYPHVVGTLWEIDDALAVRVADAFYTALVTSDTTIDTTGAAQALHHAVRAIRDELPETPSLWPAYLHAGA